MNSIVKISLAIIFLFILQSLPAHRLFDTSFGADWPRAQADIACIFAIYLGVREKSLVRGALLSILVGTFASVFAPAFMRIHVFLVPLTFVATFMINIRFYFMKLESYIILVFLMSLAFDFTSFYLLQSIGTWQGSSWLLVWPAIKQSMLDAFFGAIIFVFFDWLKDGGRHVYSH